MGQIVSGNIRGLRLLEVPTVPAEVLGLGRLTFTGACFSCLEVFTSCTDPFWYPTGWGGETPLLLPQRGSKGVIWGFVCCQFCFC